MKLNEYIKKIGDSEAVDVLGVKLRTIESWRRGERSPRPAMASVIEKKTRGVVTFSECFNLENNRLAS